MRDNKSQYLDKVNVWAGIIGDHLISLFFIDGNLNSEMYGTMLLFEQIIPAIRKLFSNVSIARGCVWSVSFRGNSLTIESSEFCFNSSIVDRLIVLIIKAKIKAKICLSTKWDGRFTQCLTLSYKRFRQNKVRF